MGLLARNWCTALQLFCAMPERLDQIHTAIDLVSIHGRRARQIVVDEILAAVRNHDIVAAKEWDEIGRAVDERLDRADITR